MQLHTWWDGGSKSNYVLIGPNGIAQSHTWHPMFDGGMSVPPSFDLPVGHILVEHETFCGKDAGITIWARPEDWQNTFAFALPETT